MIIHHILKKIKCDHLITLSLWLCIYVKERTIKDTKISDI